jgi:molybdopterin synthase sulfur carrier subunit
MAGPFLLITLSRILLLLKKCLKRYVFRLQPLLTVERGGNYMVVKVRIPTPLQRLTQGQEEVEGRPGTVIDLINELDKRFPGIGERISEGGKIRRFVNIYVNEEDVRFLKAEETEVKEGDEVSIIPAIAGG